MLFRLTFAVILFFAIYYVLKNNGYISVNQNFDPKHIFNFDNKLLEEKTKIKKELEKKYKDEELIKSENIIIDENKQNENMHHVYLDIEINKNNAGRIEIELYDDIVPKTCNNFRSLCKQKMYSNSIFHRIIKNFMSQGGDFTKGNGTGGRSIYGESFEDENFNIKHDKKGIISMANRGANTNNSQFFIIYEPQPSLDNKHVAFGCVKKGFEVLDKLNLIITDYNNKPSLECKITDCGIIEVDDNKNLIRDLVNLNK